jgi:hypothetical protein
MRLNGCLLPVDIYFVEVQIQELRLRENLRRDETQHAGKGLISFSPLYGVRSWYGVPSSRKLQGLQHVCSLLKDTFSTGLTGLKGPRNHSDLDTAVLRTFSLAHKVSREHLRQPPASALLTLGTCRFSEQTFSLGVKKIDIITP